jgi:hypothetical protein
MRKDFSTDSFRTVEAAANQIILARGMPEVDSDRLVYTEGDLSFIREVHHTIIKYKGEVVFHAIPIDSAGGAKVSPFYPDDWIDEVERVFNSLPPVRD